MSRTSLMPLMLTAFLCSVFLSSAVSSRPRAEGPAPALPDAPAKSRVQAQCAKCHSLA